MHVIKSDPSLSKIGTYREIGVQLSGLFSGERNGLANTANMCALLYQMLPDVNWVGFYFLREGELVLGPFQGKVACVRIPLGRGVCGTAAARRETLVVPDVNEFPGHIACDAASRSEIVLPLVQDGRLLGVLDLDSPKISRFDHEDREGLKAAVNVLLKSSQLGNLANDTFE
jgi:L-methionine (R)-S-oxide reductase